MEEIKNINLLRPELSQKEMFMESPGTVFHKADYLAVFMVMIAARHIWDSYIWGGIYWVVFAMIYVGANFLYVKMQKRLITKESYLYAGFVLAAGICLVIINQSEADEIASGFVIPLMLFYHGFGVYFILTLNGNRIDGCLNERGVLDLLRGIFVIPIVHSYRLVQAAVYGIGKLFTKRIKGKQLYSERMKQVVIGIAIGCLILLIAVPLLMGAEESFSTFMHSIIDPLFEINFNVSHIFRPENIIIFMIACYLYGLSYGSGKTKVPVLTKREPKFTLAAITSQVVVCGLYLLFFIIKFADAAVKMGRGSGTFVYSSYARAGFFELCGIAFLNVMIYYLIRFMAEWNHKKIKVLSTIFCIETIAFVVLAFYKMCLYIDAYGYTFKRVFTSWFMLVLLVGFVLFVYQIWREYNVIRITILFGAVSFLTVSYVWCF